MKTDDYKQELHISATPSPDKYKKNFFAAKNQLTSVHALLVFYFCAQAPPNQRTSSSNKHRSNQPTSIKVRHPKK